MRQLRVMLACLLWLNTSVCVANDTRADAAGSAGCRFERPTGWAEPVLRWTGGCQDGNAHGLGVLRAYVGGRASRLFFGRLQAGRLVIGVVELPEGYVAGEFRDGRPLDSDDRALIIKAFDEAQAAARLAADEFQQAGNGASARYYRDKARQLARQMD